MINIRTLKKLNNNDGLTLKNGKAITYKSGWQVATHGIETSDINEAMKQIRACGGNCGDYCFLRSRAFHRHRVCKQADRTGFNTVYGIQNLEYDSERNVIMAAVYKGTKEKYPNYNMFFIDMEKAPVYTDIEGINEKGEKICEINTIESAISLIK